MSLYEAPSGDFTPFVKYNAKAGRWYVRKDGEDVEVSNPTFVADLANVKKAWMYFMEGQAPSVTYFKSLAPDENLERPSENHKLGLSLQLFSDKAFGGVVKLESNSVNTCTAISELYEEYKAAKESGEGKLPVVKVTGAEPIKGNYGTNYKPTFKIEKWVDRPAELDASVDNDNEPVAEEANGGSEF